MPTDDDRAALIASAGRMGLDPVQWGGLMSYESGLDPSRWGGSGGRHVGLIQFGPTEQRQFGVTGDETFQEQLPKVEAFMLSRGYRPGMGLMQAYSTVNAGSPGHLDASDAGNGGMPGTVADKVNTQFGPHFQRAASFLGGGATMTLPATAGGSPSRGVFSLAGPVGVADPAAPASAPADKADDDATTKLLASLLNPQGQGQGAPAAAAAGGQGASSQPTPAAMPHTAAHRRAAPAFDAARFFAMLPGAR